MAKRIHLLGIAHTKTTKEYSNCAFTQKVFKLIPMLQYIGYEVIHYGAEGSQVNCENVVCVTDKLQKETYGDYDWRKEQFKFAADDAVWTTFNENASRQVLRRKRDGDLLLMPFGIGHKPVMDAVKMPFSIESGIGYAGVCAPFKVFESYAWMHYIYGRDGISNPKWYDAVIPNYFDPNDFDYNPAPQDYYVYLGRLNADKGVQIAIDVTKHLGKKLFIAGQGDPNKFNLGETTYVGSVNPAERNQLLRNATAVFVPSEYVEPFGGVAVEAMLCGTPVITTDWGAFPETVLHGITGYRCRTFADFVWAAEHIRNIDRATCRLWSVNNYSLERISRMYQAYFKNIEDLEKEGWYTLHPERYHLDWLSKQWQK